MIPLVLVLAAVVKLQQSAPTVTHYRFESRNVSTIDMSAFGAPVQERKAVISAFLSMTSRDSADGRAVMVMIDSLTRDDGGAMAEAAASLAPEMTASGKGVSFALFLVDGKTKRYAISSPTNLDATTVSAAIGLLFPGVSGLTKVGDRWNDTSRSDGASSSSEIAHWTRTTRDTLNASVTTSSTTETGSEIGPLVTTGFGTRLVVIDRSGVVREGRSSMSSSGAAGEAKIKGTTTVTLTRMP